MRIADDVPFRFAFRPLFLRVSQAPVPGNESLHLKFPVQTFFPIVLADPTNQGRVA